jgi:P-type Ca2+ transporter type 2C
MEKTWHTLPVKEVLEKLNTREQGLTENEVALRLKENGLNKLPETKREGLLIIFLKQFENPLIYILLAAGSIVFFLGDITDCLVILFVLLFNAIIGAVQEGKAQNTLLALKQFVETKALVSRDNRELIVSDTEVVPGDIIFLREGEKVSADARIIRATNLKIDEAALTGESEAVLKFSDEITNADAATIDQKNMVFKGTHIVSGTGMAVVVATGANTIIGKIANEILSIDTEIPIKANIRNLSRLIIYGTAFICAVIFVVGIVRGNSVLTMFSTVVSVAVSVIPEGLPVALTLILATGVWRMSKRNALVKKMQAVEALGQAEVIAVDKTGTITKNEMVIQSLYIDGKVFEVEGVGYEPKGGVKLFGENVSPLNHEEILFAGKVAAYCANARTMYSEENKLWRVSGDPTEAAMYVFAQKLGFDKDEVEKESPLINEIPFDYKIKHHTTLHQTPTGQFMTVVGAPELILKLSTKVWHQGIEKSFRTGEEEELEKELEGLLKKGLRVLAFAYSTTPPEDLHPENISSLTFAGFFGLKDALRPEVIDATRRAKAAGIKVVMITGDHKSTAEALAREAEIFIDGDKILTGEDLDSLPDEKLLKLLPSVSVFARVTPEHKLRIVNAYKSRGEIIAMTGDGVNDAPSLVAADLGVAMGKIGTEVAKEASDIILLDDNFGSIVSAVEEGRSIYKTIQKVVLYLISTSIGEVFVIAAAIFIGLPLPLLPAQIIWLNFVTDGFFTAALALEPKEKNLLSSNFEKPNKYIVDSLMGMRMILMALPMTIGTLILFSAYHENNIAHAWTISLTTLAVFQWLNAWNCRSEKESVFASNPLSNKSMVWATLGALIAQILAVYHPFFQSFLRTVPLGINDWFLIISFTSSVILVEEIRKIMRGRYKARHNSVFHRALSQA